MEAGPVKMFWKLLVIDEIIVNNIFMIDWEVMKFVKNVNW